MPVSRELNQPADRAAAEGWLPPRDVTRVCWRSRTPLLIDGAIALLLFVGAAIGGLSYWKGAVANGQPFYYQNYFEPAVMLACGKGLVVARPQVPAMVPFLWRQTDRFSCDAIGPDAPLGTDDMFQLGSWRYLMLAVGSTWRVFGVSWSALGPLFAVLFGATIASVYAVFRLGMGPILAVAGSLLLSVSELHLAYLPVLRDYAKAPFTLILIFLLGLLVKQRVTWRSLIGIAAAYGVTLGVGFGFRTDFLADFLPFFVVVALFLDGGVLRNVPAKIAAGAVCVAMFMAAAWPVISTLDKSRPGCQWHVVLLGFANQFSEPLGVEPAPYDVNREYLDEYAYTTVTSYAGRVQPGVGHIEFCEARYGVATRAYVMDVVTRFPADVIVRAYASILRIVELPFIGRGSDDENGQRPPRRAADGTGLALVVAALALAMAANMRAGAFLLFFVLYFCGLPAVQYDARHFFHLEFVAWWAAGFLLQSAFTQLRLLMQQHGWRAAAAPVARTAAVLTGCLAVLVLALDAARAYQQAAAQSLLARYLASGREQLPLAQVLSPGSEVAIRVSPHADPETADFIAVDLNGSRCGARTTVAFRYDQKSRRAYSRVFEVPRDEASRGLTHIFMPIYDGFERLEFSDAPPGCVDGVSRVREPGQFPLLLEVMLRPGWRRAPLYQRLRGRDPERGGASHAKSHS